MNHRRARYLFAASVGLVVAIVAYRWITNPDGRIERAQQEQVVFASRARLGEVVSHPKLQIVDPLAPNRKVGKVYVYDEDGRWVVSGYYRRSARDKWHPYLLQMDTHLALLHLKVGDAALLQRASDDPQLEAMR